VEVQLDSLKAWLDRTGLRFRIWDPLAVFMVISFAIILYTREDTIRTTDVVATIALAAGTTIPTLIGYHRCTRLPHLYIAALLCFLAVELIGNVLAGFSTARKSWLASGTKCHLWPAFLPTACNSPDTLSPTRELARFPIVHRADNIERSAVLEKTARDLECANKSLAALSQTEPPSSLYQEASCL